LTLKKRSVYEDLTLEGRNEATDEEVEEHSQAKIQINVSDIDSNVARVKRATETSPCQTLIDGKDELALAVMIVR